MARKQVSVIQETDTNRNIKFIDHSTKQEMSLPEFVQKIESGKYPNYHIRVINRVKTPVSNPDQKKGNNLD